MHRQNNRKIMYNFLVMGYQGGKYFMVDIIKLLVPILFYNLHLLIFNY